LLSTYGFSGNAFEGSTQIDRQRLRHGEKTEIFGLCKYYEKSKHGLWSPPSDLGVLLAGAGAPLAGGSPVGGRTPDFR